MLRYLSNIQKSAAIYHLHPNELCRPKRQTPNTMTKCKNSTYSDRSQPTFEAMMQNRRMQAMQTIVVESSPKEYNRLMELCSNYGSIKSVHHQASSFYVIEFNRIGQVRELMRDVGYLIKNSNSEFMSNGRFLKFAPKKKAEGAIRERRFQSASIDTKPRTWDQILASVQIRRTINEQIGALYEVGSLSDLSTRLRFLTALQIEEALSGIAANARVLPFGSSINGFGRTSSDLDMLFVIDKDGKTSSELNFFQPSMKNVRGFSSSAKHLEVFSKILSTWIPGISKVEEIFGARVPIIRFNHMITDLQCDFLLGHQSGYYMSNLLYNLCQLDSRVQPLVIFVRQWAQVFKITPAFQPSYCITNFMLTCFVIFFLQQSKILPPTNSLVKTTTDLSQNVVYTICQSNQSPHSEDTSSLHRLAVDFFDYYSNFEFKKCMISILTGDVQPRTKDNPIEIKNPLEASLNVSAVVSLEERDKFVQACKYAVTALTEKNMDIVQLFESATNIKNLENSSGRRSTQSSREHRSRVEGRKPSDDSFIRTTPLPSKSADRCEQLKSNKQKPPEKTNSFVSKILREKEPVTKMKIGKRNRVGEVQAIDLSRRDILTNLKD